jgi:biotin operon repressor
MTQRERDRLVALKKTDKKLITQKQAAQQLGLSERQIRRLLAKLRSEGDQAVSHAARGRASNRKISAKVEKQAVAILSKPLYAGFGPTLAAEYLEQRRGIHFGRETLRRVVRIPLTGITSRIQFRLVQVRWRAHSFVPHAIHTWRRRSRTSS